MELKLACLIPLYDDTKLLIVPYGIEITVIVDQILLHTRF